MFPVWLILSFWHSKHEAFAFKYDPLPLKLIDSHLMSPLTLFLYLNALGFYLLVFLLPFLLNRECGIGLHFASHYAFAGYSVLNLLMEVAYTLYLQHKVKDHNLLHLNKWHLVELFMGQILRFDFYLDVCLAVLFLDCQVWSLFIPVFTSLLLSMAYPVYK